MAEAIAEVAFDIFVAEGSTAALAVSEFLTTWGTVVNVVGALAVTSAQAAAARRKARDAAAASAQDRTITLRGATLPRREVLGRATTGGDLIWPASTGPSKTEFVMVLALSAREIDAVEQVFYDGQPITLDGDGYAISAPFLNGERKSFSEVVTLTTGTNTITLANQAVAGSAQVLSGFGGYEESTGTYTSGGAPIASTLSSDGLTLTVSAGAFSGAALLQYQYDTPDKALRVLIHRGQVGQVVDPTVTAMFPAEWDASHRLDGIAYAVVISKYAPTSFPQGLKGLAFLVRGSKVLDPRTGLTVWTDNPALLVRHVCQAPLDPAIPAVPVNDADCIAAANVCDQTVSYSIGGVSTTRKRYIAGTVYSEADAPIKSIDELCQAMAGGRVFTGGKLRMRAGAFTAPVMSLTDADFMGGAVDVVPTLPREQLVNVANAKAWDPGNRWQLVDVPEVRSSIYITADGGALPPLSVELSAVYDMAQAQQLLAIMLREARSAFTLTAQFRLTAYPLEVFDVVSVFNSRYMAAPINMIVLGRKWSLDGGIVLTLRATSADIYADGTAFDAPLIPPASLLPLPWSVAAPTGTTITSDPATVGDGTQAARMQVLWTLHPDAAVRNGGAIETQYRPADEAEPAGDWPNTMESGRATSTNIRGVQQNRYYLVRQRAWNGPAVSAWGVQKLHLVSPSPLVATANMQPGSTIESGEVLAASTSAVGYGFGNFIVLGKRLTVPVTCRLSVQALLEVTGTLDDAQRGAFLFLAPWSKVSTTGSAADLSDRGLTSVNPADGVILADMYPGAASRLPFTLRSYFDVTAGDDIAIGVLARNPVPASSGITVYGRRRISWEFLKR